MIRKLTNYSTKLQLIRGKQNEKTSIVTELRDEAVANKRKPSFFTIARDLTILGYYSSEIGCTQAREYLAIPGKYDGSAPLEPGQKAWATS